MGFVLDGLDTESYDRTYSDRELVGRIIGYFRPYTRQMVLVATMITLSSMAGTGGPIVISNALEIVAANPAIETMLLAAGGVLLMEAAAWVLNYIRQLFSARVIGDVVLNLREDIFDATVGHDLSEARGLRAVLGDRARSIPALAVKGAIGNNGAGSGAIDLAAAALCIQHNAIPPAPNTDTIDPKCGLNVVAGDPIDAKIDTAVSVAYALGGGQNAALILKRTEA